MGFENQITKEAIKDVDDTLQIMKDRPDADMRMQECKTSQDRIDQDCMQGEGISSRYLKSESDHGSAGPCGQPHPRDPPGNPRHIEIQSI